jgi:predicted amidohydrolase YtcJ
MKKTATVEVGKLADIAVLDQDYFSVSDEEIKDIQVDLTIVGGDVVWERELADQKPGQ